MLARLSTVLLLFSVVQTPDRVQLTFDTSEAEVVLDILALRSQGEPVPDAQWQQLFATTPYRRLKQREKAIGEFVNDPSIAFTDDDFKQFVLSEDLRSRAPALSSTLDRWRNADLRTDAARALTYLPPDATIRAQVYPVIKPRRNTFVWEASTDPAIFVYLDPAVSWEKFANTVTHELHHIGLASVGPIYSNKIAALSEPVRWAAGWLSAFGEGMAMLAAAGGPDRDPHAASSREERAGWEHDMGRFSENLRTINQFFLDVVNDRFSGKGAVDEAAGAFFGRTQGPWYTVGYGMAVLVEKRFGRSALIGTMLDPRCLLVLYNKAAAEQAVPDQSRLPVWSAEILAAVQAGACDTQ